MSPEEILTEVAYEVTADHPVASFAPKLVGRWVFMGDPSYSYRKEDALNIIRTCEYFGIAPTVRITSGTMMAIVEKFQQLEARLDELEGEVRA